jgi:hypothetical protein
MKKLEDIPKSDVFKVPEGYFDRLPGVIQARVADVPREAVWAPWLRYGLRFALPVAALVVAAVFYRNAPGASPEELLASVNSTDLVVYLGETDITSDDLLEKITLDNDEASSIQSSSIREINLNDAAMDSLANEFGTDNF